MKRIVMMVVLVALCLSLFTVAGAATKSVDVVPTLSFSGTTANCRVNISRYGSEIHATLQLWRGTTLVGIWSGTEANNLTVTGSCAVTRGKTYTLKVFGTINGVSFTGTNVTRTC